jgi:hypothetical protein
MQSDSTYLGSPKRKSAAGNKPQPPPPGGHPVAEPVDYVSLFMLSR